MQYFDSWLDFFRIGVFLISIWCFMTLLRRFHQYNKDWSDKTRDYWYALLMWTVVGIVAPIQGIVLNRPLTPAFAVMFAAILTTGKGLHTKGAWGGDDA